MTQTITINATPAELYGFWKNVENLPLFMEHLESVSQVSERVSHWVAKAPAGTSVEWDAEIVDDQPERRLGWRTLPGSQVTHEGMVSFEPRPRGAAPSCASRCCTCRRRARSACGSRGCSAKSRHCRSRDDLRKLKQLLETGEVATTLGQSAGKRSLFGRATLGRRIQ